ncbi:hypothetical protein LshimejAT787_0104270 [Lyophyllum shimeji]|uniref:Uncharacterized protein n=1 Tax=Lyophyllum shimeji TaxID=47721 RepID=A0A9P3PDP5_LYOSH|nr:hypothetical protein LshimejAT787_0104270 [Lyophyllum shimeji]
MLARRQLLSLTRQFVEARTSIKILEQELDVSWREIMTRKHEIQQLQGTIREMMQDIEQRKALYKVKEAERAEFEGEVKHDLQRLIKEAENSRTHATALRGLGTSLADVAAFMQEMELEMGMTSVHGGDQRGIERLRLLALQLEKIDAQRGNKDDLGAPVDEVAPY